MVVDRISEYTRRIEMLQQQRAVFNNVWDQISEVVRPEAASFTGTYDTPGRKAGARLLDAVGQHSCELLAAGFYSLLTNPQTKWFDLQTTNPTLRDLPQVKQWLIDSSQVLATEMQRPQTGFTQALQEFYLDYCAFGNGILYTTSTPDSHALQFIALPLQECFFLEGPDNQVASLYRKYRRKVAEVVDFFTLPAVSKDVHDAYLAGRYDESVDLLHVIEPSSQALSQWNTLAYSNIYIDLSHKHIMHQGGFHERPFQVARFRKTSYEIYGRGPGHTALPDLQTLQEVMKTTLKAAQKLVDPPLAIPDAAFIEPVNLKPGAVTFYRPDGPNDQIIPLNGNADPSWGFQTAQDIRNRIRSMFYVDQLQLNEGPQMTATEVLQRTEEKMRMMGPVVGRAMTELLSPLIERSFYILYRKGLLPSAPPQVLESWPGLSIVYLSPFAKVLDQNEANGIMRVTQLISPFMDVNPEVMDIFSTDNIARRLMDMYAIYPACVRTEEEVAALRTQRAEAAQQQQMVQMMQQGGQGFANMASGLKQLSEAQAGTPAL